MQKEKKRPRDIFLVITNKCNLSCRYCYEHIKNADSLDVELAKRILQKEFNLFDGGVYSAIRVIFHGGEPFLEFERMRSIAEWAWARHRDLDVRFSATTNGTMISTEAKQWLKRHRRHFLPILSLDGAKETQDYNRSNSYDLIDIDFFRTLYREQPVKMTVAPENIDKLFDNFVAIRELGLIPNPSLAKEVAWDLEKSVPVFSRELMKLIDFYLDNPELQPCQLVGMPIEQISYPPTDNTRNCCGAGDNVVAYSTSGQAFPCHAFMGNGNSGAEQVFHQLKDPRLFVAKDCERCLIYSCCSPCYGLNFSNRGDVRRIDHTMCVLSKIRVLATAKMLSQMLLEPQLYALTKHLHKDRLAGLARSIKTIFDHLTIEETHD